MFRAGGDGQTLATAETLANERIILLEQKAGYL